MPSSSIRLCRPGGLRSVVAESVLMRHQVLILHRGWKRAPNLRSSDRDFHKMLTKQKYRLLFSSTRVRRPGPKGPTNSTVSLPDIWKLFLPGNASVTGICRSSSNVSSVPYWIVGSFLEVSAVCVAPPCGLVPYSCEHRVSATPAAAGAWPRQRHIWSIASFHTQHDESRRYTDAETEARRSIFKRLRGSGVTAALNDGD
jgi:hypothetical protein